MIFSCLSGGRFMNISSAVIAFSIAATSPSLATVSASDIFLTSFYFLSADSNHIISQTKMFVTNNK